MASLRSWSGTENRIFCNVFHKVDVFHAVCRKRGRPEVVDVYCLVRSNRNMARDAC